MELADSHLGLSRPSESPEAAEMLPVFDAGCSNSNNFGFAFDDINFSDRTLRIEIVPDLTEDSKTGDEGHDGISDSARYRKRRRIINGNDAKLIAQHEEQILSCHMPDSEECVSYGNRDEEAVAMIEEGPAGVGLNANQIGRSTEGSDPSSSDPSTVLRVKIIHITSAILAANSRFFYKLFSNGMRESEQRHVTLRIHESEEAAFMDLLNFMYSNTLPRTSPPALLEVLMVADKYEVASCMNYCCRVMKNIPMTSESALLYLDLPSSVLMADAVQPLIVCAKQFLASRYKDYTKCIGEVLNLPLAGIEQVFSSTDLQTGSEDAVYDFLLKWAQTHYPKLEERKEIVSTRLVRLIRFPFMSCSKLKKVRTSPDFDGELASKSVLEALFFKEEPPHRQHILAGDKSNPLHHRFVPRTYRYRPVRWMEFDQPHQHCVVYLDLNHEECKNLYPAGWIISQSFNLGGQGFYLSAHCQVDQLNSIHCFGLFVGMQEKGCTSLAVDFEFATRSKPMNVYISRRKGICTFTAGKSVGRKNLFGVTWEEFIAENSQHFINGVLHIRAELTIMK